VPLSFARIKRTRSGRFQLRIPPAEREILRRLAGELRELLGTEDPALVRLFPPGDASDPRSDAQYRALVSDDLTAQRLEGLQTLERTLDAQEVSEEELSAWLAVVNDLRLVLGTRLEVTEEMNETGVPPGDPRAPTFDLYRYLTWLQWQLVEGLAAGLPREGTGSD
jgi:hypothetical protein